MRALAPAIATLFPCGDEVSGHCPRKVDGKPGMPGLGFDGTAALAVSVANLIPYRAEVVHDRLTVTEDSFKGGLLMLMWREI